MVEETGDFLSRLQFMSASRQVEWAGGREGADNPLFFATEFGGEAGEILNVVKKLERERFGWPGSRDTVEHLGEEMADGLITLVNLANLYGIDLVAVTTAKFNKTSDKVGLSQKV